MHSPTIVVLAGQLLMACVVVASAPQSNGQPHHGGRHAALSRATQRIDLVGQLAEGKLRKANREVTVLKGYRDAVRVSEKPGTGVVWIEGSNFVDGAIDVDIRGRDVFQRSFVGIAFHREDDGTYDAVYLRPFNFRAADPVRRHHAVQYVSFPDYDWPRLRMHFPEQFENPVDRSAVPDDWVPLRVVVNGPAIHVYVGLVKSPTLEVRKLGVHDRGMIGLWTGDNSSGDFANLRLTPAK